LVPRVSPEHYEALDMVAQRRRIGGLAYEQNHDRQ
jgi:hypothetical protein